jgi:hypothetical protein
MKNMKKQASSREDRFLKTILGLSPCRTTEDDGSRDLLSRSHMPVDEWDEVALVAQQRRMWKLRCVGESWLFIVTSSLVAAHIYREDLPRVTALRNWLGLSLSKRIRHGLIVKINSKRKLRTCEALHQISMDHSRARRVPAPITSPHHAMLGQAQLSEASKHAHVFLPFFSPPYSCKCRGSNPLLSRLPSTSTSNVRLKSCHPRYMNGRLRYIRNCLWARPNNSNIPHQISKSRLGLYRVPTPILYTSVSMEIVKLNFHLEQ